MVTPVAGTLPFQIGEVRSHKLCTITPTKKIFFNLKNRNFSGIPVVKTLQVNAESIGSIPYWEIKILHAVWHV